MSTQGIFHRDLTLDNILVKEDNGHIFMKLCDFGVSGTPDDYAQIPRGKMRNYAPESMTSNIGTNTTYEYTSKSDLYMFGLVIWEMINGHLVWDKFNTSQANKKVMAGEIP